MFPASPTRPPFPLVLSEATWADDARWSACRSPAALSVTTERRQAEEHGSEGEGACLGRPGVHRDHQVVRPEMQAYVLITVYCVASSRGLLGGDLSSES